MGSSRTLANPETDSFPSIVALENERSRAMELCDGPTVATIDGLLYRLWEQRRREIAAIRNPAKPNVLQDDEVQIRVKAAIRAENRERYGPRKR